MKYFNAVAPFLMNLGLSKGGPGLTGAEMPPGAGPRTLAPSAVQTPPGAVPNYSAVQTSAPDQAALEAARKQELGNKLLALSGAVGGMSMRPNQGVMNLAQMGQKGLQESAAQKQQVAMANKTAGWFAAQGRDDLASLITQNPSSAADVYKAYVKSMLDAKMNAGNKVVGDALVDQQGNVIYKADPKVPDSVAKLQWLVDNPDQAQVLKQLGAIGGSSTKVEVPIHLGGDKFVDKTNELVAKDFQELVGIGQRAGRTSIELDALEKHLAKLPGGASSRFLSVANSMGIPLGEGVSEVAAAEAIINRLVPQQRPSGSGPMSDADLELFKRSLPRLMNSPSGNAQIIKTMREVAAYDQQMAAIAAKAQMGEITVADARRQMSQLSNPLGWLKGDSNIRQQADAILGGQ